MKRTSLGGTTVRSLTYASRDELVRIPPSGTKRKPPFKVGQRVKVRPTPDHLYRTELVTEGAEHTITGVRWDRDLKEWFVGTDKLDESLSPTTEDKVCMYADRFIAI